MVSKTIKISNTLSLPLEAITNTFAVFGIRGAGKSNIGAVMAEGIIKAGQPVCIIDPVGAWYGLKSSADGRGPGLSIYVFGGEHADIPLEPTAGEVLANFVVERRVPVVLDLKLMRKHEQIKFMVTFAETLFHRNREPLMVFIDEAARFAPQVIKDKAPEAARCLGAMEDLATLGRSRGLGVTLMAQRPAPVSTTLRTQVENLICLRTIGKHDRRALDEWVEAKGTQQERDQMMKDLAELPDGVGYFWSPGWLHRFVKVHFNLRETFDSGRTPKIGEKLLTPRAFAEIDKGQLSAEIKATIERAKADDPKELRRRIADLEKAANAKPAPAKLDPFAAKASHREAVEKAAGRAAAQMAHQLARECKTIIGPIAKTMLHAVVTLRTVAAELEKALPAENMQFKATVDFPLEAPPATRPSPTPQARPARPTPAPRKTVEGDPSGALTGPEQRILDAIAWLESIGVDTPEQPAVAFLAGYTFGGGAFNNPRGSLRTAGLVEYAGDAIRLTDVGRQAAHFPAEVLDSRELQRRVLDRLPGPERRILEVILKSYPEPIGYDDCARAAGYTPGGGAFNNPRGRLRSLGLIEYPSPGMVQAKTLLFLGDR